MTINLLEKGKTRMATKKTRKILVSLIVLFVGILAFTNIFNTVLIEKTFIHRIDKNADEYLDKTMKKALFTFAIARGINAIISVIQDSDIAISPAGMGITIAVGEILDPVNDLIERFSWVMLASTTSLGIQRILVNIGRWLGFRVLLSFAMLAILSGIWFPQLFRSNIKQIGYRLVLAAIAIRFCIPAVAIATDKIDLLFLDAKYSQATQTLEKVRDEIKEDETSVSSVPSDTNILAKVRSLFNSIKNAVNIEEKIQNIKNTVSGYIEYIIDLIVIFILQTIVIPLVILWILIKLFGSIFDKNLAETITPKFGNLVRKKRVATEEG